MHNNTEERHFIKLSEKHLKGKKKLLEFSVDELITAKELPFPAQPIPSQRDSHCPFSTEIPRSPRTELAPHPTSLFGPLSIVEGILPHHLSFLASHTALPSTFSLSLCLFFSLIRRGLFLCSLSSHLTHSSWVITSSPFIVYTPRSVTVDNSDPHRLRPLSLTSHSQVLIASQD